MIGITALMGSALLFGSLILAGIAGWVMEVVCTRQEAREMKAKRADRKRKICRFRRRGSGKTIFLAQAQRGLL